MPKIVFDEDAEIIVPESTKRIVDNNDLYDQELMLYCRHTPETPSPCYCQRQAPLLDGTTSVSAAFEGRILGTNILAAKYHRCMCSGVPRPQLRSPLVGVVCRGIC